jgi:hypothetical protein
LPGGSFRRQALLQAKLRAVIERSESDQSP